MNGQTLNAKLCVIDKFGRFVGHAQNVAVTEDLIKLSKSTKKSYDFYLEGKSWERAAGSGSKRMAEE